MASRSVLVSTALAVAALCAASCKPSSPTGSSAGPQVHSVTLSPTAATLNTGDLLLVTATVTADPGANQSLTWSSGNASVASVDQSGKVTANASGTATITATSKTTPNVAGTTNITVNSPVDLSSLLGTFNVSATKTTDTGCNFSPGFTGQVTLGGNRDGTALAVRIVEQVTRTYNGTLQSNGVYSANGSGNLNGFNYTGTVAGAVGGGGATITGQETMNFTTGCAGRLVVYSFTGAK